MFGPRPFGADRAHVVPAAPKGRGPNTRRTPPAAEAAKGRRQAGRQHPAGRQAPVRIRLTKATRTPPLYLRARRARRYLSSPPISYQPLTAASRRARTAFRCGRRELLLLPMSHAAQCCGLPLLPGHHRSAHQGEPAEASPRPRADDPQEPRCHHRLPPSISCDTWPTSAGTSSRWPTAALARPPRAFRAPRTSRVGASSAGPAAYLDTLPNRGAEELAHLRDGRRRALATLVRKAGGYLAWSGHSEQEVLATLSPRASPRRLYPPTPNTSPAAPSSTASHGLWHRHHTAAPLISGGQHD
jgi:hypothetical protein